VASRPAFRLSDLLGDTPAPIQTQILGSKEFEIGCITGFATRARQYLYDKARAPKKAALQRVRVAIGNALIRDAKNKPCMDCGQSYPWFVMDLDHVRGTKRAAVSRLRHFNPKVILAEIAKCDVVCSNCHRLRTFKRYGK